MIKYKYIAIEGNIGAGKSTLTKLLHRFFGGELLLETFEENDSLKAFYENPSFALNAEVQFLLDRSLQLQKLNEKNHELIFADYVPLKSLIFAKENLSKQDYAHYENLAKRLLDNFPQPDIIIFLNRSIPNLLDNIRNRGRSYESNIDEMYLQKVQNGYENELFKLYQCPILQIEGSTINLKNQSQLANAFEQILSKDYAPTVRKISI